MDIQSLDELDFEGNETEFCLNRDRLDAQDIQDMYYQRVIVYRNMISMKKEKDILVILSSCKS